jgi:hypothetical protein
MGTTRTGFRECGETRPPRAPRSERVTMTPTSWRPIAELELPVWAEAGRRLGAIGRGVGWWIGDWLRYGNRRFGERYARAKRITGYDVQTLMNMAYVASRFEPTRRRESLSFSHHAELAAFAQPAQDRWLDRAEGERLSVRCLREELRRERRELEKDPASNVEPLPTRSSPTLVCPRCGVRMHAERGAA